MSLLRRAAAAALLAMPILALTALAWGRSFSDSAEAGPGDVTLLALDVDVDDDGDTSPDNNDSTVGIVNDCIELILGDTIDIDLVVRGVDPADRIAGYQVDIDYDPAVIGILNVVDVDARGSLAPNDVTMISRINSTGGVGLLPLTDIFNNPNSATVAAADGTTDAFFHVAGVQAFPLMHEPGDAANAIDDDFDGTVDEPSEASQDGVLARITVQAVGTGLSQLIVPGPTGGPDGSPDQIIISGVTGEPLPITDVDFAAISVGQPCVPVIEEGHVEIVGLDCSSNPEVVTITNIGMAAQDLSGWLLTSELSDLPNFDLSIIGFGTPNAGRLLAGQSVKVYSGSQAPSEIDVALGKYPWDTNEKFRDFDSSDHAQILDGQSTVIDTVNCVGPPVTPTPTPAPSPGPTPLPGSTPVPGPDERFDPTAVHEVSNSAAGANADIVQTFTIPGPDYNFSTDISFTPADWGVARDADVPNGALAGSLEAYVTLGLIGGACSTQLRVGFDWIESTTDTNVLVTFDDQFAIGLDGLPLGVTRYPDYLTRIFRGASGEMLVPIARLYGQAAVAGVLVSVNLVVFEPGTVFRTAAGDLIAADPRLGYPSIILLGTGSDPAGEPSAGDSNAISDFCSPLDVTNTIFGVSADNPATAALEDGVPLRTNPGPGSYDFTVYVVSQRDADLDGIENPLDPCPTIPNPGWNPRIQPAQAGYTGDADRDSLPDEAGCDPDPAEPGPISGGAYDQDGDQYGNRADNCPLVANSAGQLGGSGPDNQGDLDRDAIGDDCDPNPAAGDGLRFYVCPVTTIAIGGGGTLPSPRPSEMYPCSGESAPAPTPTPTPTPIPADTCAGLPATIVGTGGRDILLGTRGDDVILARGGGDVIFGRGGNDVICAGGGSDHVYGGEGGDTLMGEGGNDHLYGGRGADGLDGGAGRDLCSGGRGVDAATRCERTAGVP